MTKMDFIPRLRKIEEGIEKARYEKEDLLRKAGWRYSSDYPGALWLWSKDFPESTVQWAYDRQRRVRTPHKPFSVSGATTEVATIIETAWQTLWVEYKENQE